MATNTPARGKKPSRTDRALAAASTRLSELHTEIARLEAAERDLFARHPRLADFTTLIDPSRTPNTPPSL